MSIDERVEKWTYKDPNSGCWLWTGFVNKDGYGYLTSTEYPNDCRAHRVLWKHYCGEIPAGLELDHDCRVRCCVNPYHMTPRTHAENAALTVHVKERHVHGRKTHCLRGHPLSGDNIRERDGCRQCRACDAIRARVSWHKNNGNEKRRLRLAKLKAALGIEIEEV